MVNFSAEGNRVENQFNPESVRFSADIFYKSPVILTITIPIDGRIMEVNEAFLQYTEYSRQEVIGRTSIELDSLDPEINRILHTITENTTKMGHLIDDLLAFSRLGRQELKLSRINMKSLVYSVYKDLTAQENMEKVEFRLHEIPDAYGDPSLMRQVFFNLIGNAIKFSSQKSNCVIEVNYSSNEEENIYFVKDNGAGFDMAYYHKLFGVFQRLHSTSEFEGTGVGLAIVKRIILRMKGRVWAEGKVNEGAAFYFSLPANP
jgi:PAS domain S-box-containing protein